MGPQRGTCLVRSLVGECLWVRGRSCAEGTAVVLGQAPGQTQLSSGLYLPGAQELGRGLVSSASLSLGERLDCHLLSPAALQRKMPRLLEGSGPEPEPPWVTWGDVPSAEGGRPVAERPGGGAGWPRQKAAEGLAFPSGISGLTPAPCTRPAQPGSRVCLCVFSVC